MMEEKKQEFKKKEKIIAKKAFVIVQNDVHIIIKEGDNLTDIPQRFLQNLKTEGVI